MKTIFLDRDGVINPLLEGEHERISPQSVEQFEFIQGADEAIEAAVEAGYRVLVVTNQPDIGKEWRPLDEERLEEINALLREKGVEKVYYCPHGPLGTEGDSYYQKDGDIITCDCRKPQPGLLEKAVEENPVDLEKSYMVGDNVSDIETAINYEGETDIGFAGKILVGGKESAKADRSFDNLAVAIQWIVGR